MATEAAIADTVLMRIRRRDTDLTVLLDLLEVSGLACERGGRLVFRDLSFSLSRGQALSLEGANGAGKTSALRVLAGLLSPVAGTVTLNPSNGPVTDAEERGRFVGWFGHHDGVKNQMTVAENAAFAAALYGAPDSVADILSRVGLSRVADLPGQYLSAGQRRRLALARLLLSRRPLWLLDEPLAALDTAGKALVAELIAAHCAGGGIVIAATHDALGVDARRLTMGQTGGAS